MPAASATRLISRALLVRFVSVVGSSIGFYLPLAVMPLFAHQQGPAGAAALPTVALLVASLAGELATPRMLAWIGYRWALALGLTLLGAPMLALTASGSAVVLVAVSVVRGGGFAICVVAGGALTATLIPPERRGEGFALVGLVGGIPAMLALPAGVWAAARWGYAPVFLVTAVITVSAVFSVPALPRKDVTAGRVDYHGVRSAVRNPALSRLAVIFATSTAAVGVLVTFLPLATTDLPSWVATAALLAQPAATTVARCAAGRVGDLHGHAVLLVPAVLAAGTGVACLAATAYPVAVIGGALLFGLGFGALQNATLVLMYARTPPGAEAAVSALWNATYDLGMVAGAIAAGLTVPRLGYPTTFALTAVLLLAALPITRHDHTARQLATHQ